MLNNIFKLAHHHIQNRTLRIYFFFFRYSHYKLELEYKYKWSIIVKYIRIVEFYLEYSRKRFHFHIGYHNCTTKEKNE